MEAGWSKGQTATVKIRERILSCNCERNNPGSLWANILCIAFSFLCLPSALGSKSSRECVCWEKWSASLRKQLNGLLKIVFGSGQVLLLDGISKLWECVQQPMKEDISTGFWQEIGPDLLQRM